jgi:hypothetical protein
MMNHPKHETDMPTGKDATGLQKAMNILGLFILVLFLSGILWAFFVHEPAHYIAGTIQGKECSFGFPPRVDCKDFESLTAEGCFMLFMAPYLVSLAALVFFSANRNRIIRLIPYTAFFDVQGNLAIPQLEKIVLGLRGADGFLLIKRLDNIAPGYSFPALILILSIIGISWFIFYKKYRNDFITSKDKRFFRAAFAIFIFYMLLDFLFVVFFISPQISKG